MRARMTWTVVFVVAVITAACGDSKSSFLPTAPSTLSAGTASVDPNTAGGEYGPTASAPKPANGNGNGNGNGSGKRAPTLSTDPIERVDFEGVIEAVGDYSITVNNRVVTITTATVLRHGSRLVPFGDLRERDRVHVTANRFVSALEATEIKVQNPGDGEIAPPPPPPPDLPASVTVVALDAYAFEVGANGVDTAIFQLTRTGSTTQLGASLPVSVSFGGTASSGDYTLSPLEFAPNSRTLNVVVTPVVDEPEPTESLVLTVVAGAGYEPGVPASASVTIADVAPPTVNVRAIDDVAEENNVVINTGRFEIMRTGDLSVALPVTLQFNGTATFNVDYRLSPMPPASTFAFTFGINQAVLFLTVQPATDTVFPEDEETVVLSPVAGAGYVVGTSGTVRILGQQ